MRMVGVQAFMQEQSHSDSLAGYGAFLQILAPISQEMVHQTVKTNALSIYGPAAVGALEVGAKLAVAFLLTPVASLGLNALSAAGINAATAIRQRPSSVGTVPDNITPFPHKEDANQI